MFNRYFIIIGLLSVFFIGCKKFADPGIINEEYKPGLVSDTLKERKMLLISIDGLPAEALQAVAPANIQELLKTSKYSMNVASATKPITNAASWASMLTGNDTTRHRIWDSTFYATPVDSTNKIPVPTNLTALRYLHNKDQSISITAIAPWFNLVNTFLNDANKRIVTSNDADTKNKVVGELKNQDADFIIAQFIDVQKAGIQSGSFSASSPGFVSAIQIVDGYVGEIIASLKSRSNYTKENWLVLITTTQGGSGMRTDANIKPGFIIAHSPYFKPANIFTLTPSIATRKEDIAPQILYWFKTAVPNTIVNGSVWIDRFESEFYK